MFESYLDQNYEQIKSGCLRSRQLFEDEQFPPNTKSISATKGVKNRIFWKRPHEIVQNPEFIVQKIEPNDLDQGQLGDCWLISGAAAVASVPAYIQTVIPTDQSFDRDYAGIFRFRFWRYGKWIEVVVDDYLPVDENNLLIYCHNSKDTNEMFGPLLEKAFAKVNLCYEFLNGGFAIDSMIDMTGGVHESFHIKAKNNSEATNPTLLWEIIFKSFKMKSLSGAFIDATGKAMEQIEKNDLVVGHAYTILDVIEITSNGSKLRNSLSSSKDNRSIKLLRLRNPWGKDKSFKGKWSNDSSNWQSISGDVRNQIDSRNQVDGQFLIAYEEFLQFFDEIDFVHIDLNAFNERTNNMSTACKWINQTIVGSWVPGKTAGGCGNGSYKDFWLNPQYLANLTLNNSADDKVSMIVSLMQIDHVDNRLHGSTGYSDSNHPIAFSIFRIDDRAYDQKSNSKKYKDSEVQEVSSSGNYINLREVAKRFDLDPGNYIIIPSTFDKDTPGHFLLRIFIEGEESHTNDVQITDLGNRSKNNNTNSNAITNNNNGRNNDYNENIDKNVYDNNNYNNEMEVNDRYGQSDETGERENEQEEENEEEYEEPSEPRNRRNYDKPIKQHFDTDNGRFFNYIDSVSTIRDLYQNGNYTQYGGEIIKGVGSQVVSRACSIM